MLLGVISTFSFEFLRVLEKKSKKEKLGKSGIYGLLLRSEGHPRRNKVLRSSEGLPRRDEAEGLEKAPLGFAKVKCFAPKKQCFAAAKSLFTRAKIFILFAKVSYAYPDSLRTLIND